MTATTDRPRARLARLALSRVGVAPDALARVEVVGDDRASVSVDQLVAADGRAGARSIWISAADQAIALHHALLAIAVDATGSDALLDAGAVISTAFLDPLRRLEDARPGLLVCAAADRTIAVQAPTAAHRELVASCTGIENPDWRESVRRWAPGRSADAAAEELQAWGIPAFVARERPPDTGEPATPVVQSWPGTERSVRGAEVIELGGLWAAPYAAQLLRHAGARVTKIEAPTRPDGARGGDPVHFAALNRGKSELQLDLRLHEDRARLLSLLGPRTVVVENFTARVLPNLGLGPHVIRARGASLVRLPASRTHPDQRGLGSGIEMAAGLGRPSASRDPTSAPIPLTDALSGMVAALRAAAALRRPPELQVVGQLEDVAAPLARAAMHAAGSVQRAGGPSDQEPSSTGSVAAEEPPWEIR